MKKVFTFLVAVASVIFASAQSGNYKNDYDKGNYNRNQSVIVKTNNRQLENDRSNSYKMSAFSRDAQIQKINREYDQKIAAVKNSRRIRQQDKLRQVRFLNDQRNQEIKEIQNQWEKSNRYADNKNWGWKNDRY